MKTADYMKFLNKLFLKNNSLPIYLVLFITSRCTLNCRHCLLGQGMIKDSYEMTIDDLEKLSLSMGRLLFLLPTGGEPFLREDITEIIQMFYKNNRVCNIGIPTNGSLTGLVIEKTEDILDTVPEVDLAIDVSIDGIGDDHNYIRNNPDSFNKAVYTFRELKKLEKRHPNFNANIGLTVSAYNIDRIYDLYEFLQKDLGVRTINHLLVRGNPREDKAGNVDIDKYMKFSLFLEEEIKQGRLRGYKGFPFANLINSIRSVRPHIIKQRLERKKQVIPCLAARLGAVVLSDGMVMPCEILDKPIGDLKTAGFNFSRIWFSRERKEIVEFIKRDKCCCTYECFLTLSIFFSFSGLLKVFREYLS